MTWLLPAVRRVDELFAPADGLERKYGEAVKRVERLTPAVLAKAFRGELVPQDPGDEPASVLLERVRAQRAAEPEGLARRRVGAASRRGVAAVKVVGAVKRKSSGGRRGSAS